MLYFRLNAFYSLLMLLYRLLFRNIYYTDFGSNSVHTLFMLQHCNTFIEIEGLL